MKSTTRSASTMRVTLAALTGVAILSAVVGAQDRLKTMPGYEQYLRMSKELPTAVKMGDLSSVLEGRREGVRVREGRQDVPLRRRHEGRSLSCRPPMRRACRPGRARRIRRRAGARPAGGVGRVARQGAEGGLQEPEPLHQRRRGRQRGAGDHRRQREGPDQVRHRQLGLRRGTVADDGDVVVARTAGSWPTTGSTRTRCPTTSCSWTRRSSTARRTSRPTRSPASRTRSWTSSCTTSRRRRARRSTCGAASRSTTTSSATTSTACRGRRTGKELLFTRANRRQNILELTAANPVDGRVPDHPPRGMAHRLGRDEPDAASS